MSTNPVPQSAPEVDRAWRRLGILLAEIARTPEPIQHDGPCGRRVRCPFCGPRYDPYRSGEVLSDGDLLLHCCGRCIQPGAPGYAEIVDERP